MATGSNAVRLSRLSKVFDQISAGKDTITPKKVPHFLEAIYTHPDPPSALNRLITSPNGLSALRFALQADGSPAFMNDAAAKLCAFLAAPAVQNIQGGQYLSTVLGCMVKPPIFWGAFLAAFRAEALNPDGEAAFAWLLLQIVTAPPNELPDDGNILQVAEEPAVLARLANSSSSEAREYVHRLQHFLGTNAPLIEEEAGGRHDNDHTDYRKIAILPTEDELTCLKAPFLRTSSYLDDPTQDPGTIASIHLDNQFRLLREDMLGEIKEEIQIALGKKKGRHRGLVFDVRFGGLFTPAPGARGRIGLQLVAENDLWQLKGMDANKRKAHITKNKNIVKHGSLSCLIVDGRIIGFPCIIREEALLAQKPPTIVVGADLDKRVMKHMLLTLKMGKTVKLVQIDTAVFAFDPVLLALREMRRVPLQEELLQWEPESVVSSPASCPHDLVRRFEADVGQDLAPMLDLKKPVRLDASQAMSFRSGLKQRVSLIQGPPGKRLPLFVLRQADS